LDAKEQNRRKNPTMNNAITEIDDLLRSIDNSLQPDKLPSITREEIRKVLWMIENLKMRIADLPMAQRPDASGSRV
jgi:hypothetical protein